MDGLLEVIRDPMVGCHSRALTLAPAALDWLAHTRTARCLHVFDRACNLINERGEVLSVVAPEIGDGPFNMVLADPVPSFMRDGDAPMPIMITGERLVCAGVVIDFRDAKVWSPQPDWRTLHDRRAEIIAELMSLRGWIQVRAKPDSLMQLYPFSNKDESSKIPLKFWIGSLCAAVAHADVESCRVAARRVAGLGAGLTPAGDDLILGSIYAAWILHPPQRARAVAEALCESACSRTTSLSGAWLRAASRGEAGILWHDFLRTLLRANQMALHGSVDRLLAVGHTSGADALAGFAGSLLHPSAQGSLSSVRTHVLS